VVGDDLALIDALDAVTGRLDWEIHQRAQSDPRVKCSPSSPGIGPFTALVILAVVGDVSRFGSAPFQAIAKRRGKKIPTTAVARKLVTRPAN
jgi:transposase